MSATLPSLDETMPDPTADRADPDADRVAFTHDGRELVGTIVAREPAPQFGALNRERVTVRVNDTTLQVLAADLEQPPDDP